MTKMLVSESVSMWVSEGNCDYTDVRQSKMIDSGTGCLAPSALIIYKNQWDSVYGNFPLGNPEVKISVLLRPAKILLSTTMSYSFQVKVKF